MSETTRTIDRTPNPTMNTEVMRLMDAMETAWGIIANAHGGKWDAASPEWRAAAERWRDEQWHSALGRNGYPPAGAHA